MGSRSRQDLALLPGNERNFADDSAGELWLRITGFLSTKSPNTQKTYLGVINEWCRFLGEEPGGFAAAQKFSQAGDLHALAYRKWLESQVGQKPRLQSSPSSSRELSNAQRSGSKRDGLQSTLSNATIAKKLAALRRIYKVLMAADLGIAVNPFDRDRVPAPPPRSGQKRPTEMINFEKIKHILDMPSGADNKGLRDRAMLAVLFGGGLRRSELVALRIGDVKRTQKGTLYLLLRATKGKRDAEQALPDWAAKRVDELVAARCSQGANPADYLFVGYRGQGGRIPSCEPISDNGLYRIFKHYCERAGINAPVSPHSARATAITKLLEQGIGHREVQEFSRHASVQMVELYDKRRIGVDQNPARKLNFEE